MRAFVAVKGEDGEVTRGVRDDLEELGEGDVLVKVEWSSVNYKDALATIAKGQVARISPLIGGIDLAGTDEDSGEEVLAHGYDLGVAHHGGFGQFGQPGADLVIDRAVDIGALDRQADLPGIHEGAREQSRRNLGRIGARQHDGRVVAAQFQRQPLDG